MFHDPTSAESRVFSDTLELDLGDGRARAWPARSARRTASPLAQASGVASTRRCGAADGPGAERRHAERSRVRGSTRSAATSAQRPSAGAAATARDTAPRDADGVRVDHGSVVIAAITSCTNTSNPSVMVAAGLLAKKAVERGLRRKPWVKTSLAPGSKVVTDYLERRRAHQATSTQLRFNLVGYGCTTCIGNSGPLPRGDLAGRSTTTTSSSCAVLTGNRNFEGRINPDVRANYLASPPLVVAYALAGTMDIDLDNDPLGNDSRRQAGLPRATSGRRSDEVQRDGRHGGPVRDVHARVRRGLRRRRALAARSPSPTGDLYDVGRRLDLRARAAVLRRDARRAAAGRPTSPARGCWRCSATASRPTTSRRPARSRAEPGRALPASSTASSRATSTPTASRRGNHEVMVRGHVRQHPAPQQLARRHRGRRAPAHLPDGEEMTIFDASVRYQADGVPLIILAGKEYGSGSSRDWAAKGPKLLGHPRGDRRELRADPPLEPGRHGDPARSSSRPGRRPSRSA